MILEIIIGFGLGYAYSKKVAYDEAKKKALERPSRPLLEYK
jgi:O-antigen/teichoic acid export membrane protein